ncbi:hypothetical protein Tco_1106033 [Tanacetum coccineum]
MTRGRYRRAPQPARYSVDQHDREILGDDYLDEDEEHFIGICLQDPQTQHIPCDICFCKDCLNEARNLEEEPLNKAKRSNKPRRSKQKSWERWSTLAKRGEDHTMLHLSKNEEKDDNLPYPKFRKFKQLAGQIINKHEEHAFPTAADDAESSTSYQPPPDAIMGPTWTLPLAWMESGVMLVLPADPGLWSDVISRWESITINRLNNCLNEARTLEEEPLNKAKRSNKPRRSKQKSWERWSTLGEPSGKWDYYVRYDAPTNTTPIEEIAATGRGDR